MVTFLLLGLTLCKKKIGMYIFKAKCSLDINSCTGFLDFTTYLVLLIVCSLSDDKEELLDVSLTRSGSVHVVQPLVLWYRKHACMQVHTCCCNPEGPGSRHGSELPLVS